MIIWIILFLLFFFNNKEHYTNNYKINSNLINEVVYVNLDRRIDRKKKLLNQIKKSTILKKSKITRFSAIDGNKINRNDLLKNNKIKLYSNKVLTNGMIGCYQSNVLLWRQAYKKNKSILILEDDINIYSYFDKIMTESYNYFPLDYDIIYLGVHPYTKKYYYNKYFSTIKKKNYGTYAYLISPKGAKILLDNAYPIYCQVDSLIISLTKKNKLKCYAYNTNLVWTTQDDSSDVQNLKVGYSKTIL
jgi:GR25 family glycosyltransferase involved in LPS biosynthesis